MIEQGISVCHVFKYTDDHTNGRHRINKCSAILNLIANYKTPLTIQTQGEKGLSYRIFGDKAWHKMNSYKPQELIDTCGAGDWVTIGFLYCLKEAVINNKLDFIETLTTRNRLEEALSFAQILSSVSCMFVGARGLSDAIDRDSILKLIISKMTISNDKMIQINSDQLIQLNERNAPNTHATEKDVCYTCLLYSGDAGDSIQLNR